MKDCSKGTSSVNVDTPMVTSNVNVDTPMADHAMDNHEYSTNGTNSTNSVSDPTEFILTTKRNRSKPKNTGIYAVNQHLPTIQIYPDIDNPKTEVTMSRKPTHSAPQVKISDDGLTVQNDKVYQR